MTDVACAAALVFACTTVVVVVVWVDAIASVWAVSWLGIWAGLGSCDRGRGCCGREGGSRELISIGQASDCLAAAATDYAFSNSRRSWHADGAMKRADRVYVHLRGGNLSGHLCNDYCCRCQNGRSESPAVISYYDFFTKCCVRGSRGYGCSGAQCGCSNNTLGSRWSRGDLMRVVSVSSAM